MKSINETLGEERGGRNGTDYNKNSTEASSSVESDNSSIPPPFSSTNTDPSPTVSRTPEAENPKTSLNPGSLAVFLGPGRSRPSDPTENRHGPDHAPVYDYSSQQKAWLMWAVGIGSLAGTFPFSWVCTRYGARWIVFGAGLLSSAATVFIPFAASQNFNFFLFLRFLQVYPVSRNIL